MEETVIRAAKEAIVKSITSELVGYNKPLTRYVEQVMENHRSDFIALIDDEVCEMLNSKDFKLAIKDALNQKLAKTLVNRLGGELEKRVNELKGNPETRAKITIALSKVVSEL